MKQTHTHCLGLLLLVVGCSNSHFNGDAGAFDAGRQADGGGPCSPVYCYPVDGDCCDEAGAFQNEACFMPCPEGTSPIESCGTFCESAACDAEGLEIYARGVASSSPMQVVPLGMEADGDLVDMEFSPGPGGSSHIFRVPAEHAALWASETEFYTATDWTTGMRRSVLYSVDPVHPREGRVETMVYSDSDFNGEVRLGDLVILPGALECGATETECGVNERFGLRVTTEDDETLADIAWGQSELVERLGASYRITLGRAVHFACDECACAVPGEISFVVTAF